MDMEQATLAAQMPLDALRIFGLTLRQIPLTAEFNRGRMTAQIAAPLGDGSWSSSRSGSRKANKQC